MPIAGNMSHIFPSHTLSVGQRKRLDPEEQNLGAMESTGDPDLDLDISLANLNQLILELDPTFEPIQLEERPQSTGFHADDSSPDEDVSHRVLLSRGRGSVSSPPVVTSSDDSSPDELVPRCVLVPRGCGPGPMSLPSVVLSPSRSIPIPACSGPSCSPQGSLVFSGSPSSSRPPLPLGSVLRRRGETSPLQGFRRLSPSDRNSGASLLSMSAGSDTSYLHGSCLSLTSDDENTECLLSHASGFLTDLSSSPKSFHTRQSSDRPWPTGTPLGHLQGIQSRGNQSSPASLAGSLTDIPVVLVNGTRQPEFSHRAPAETFLTHTIHNTRPASPHTRPASPHSPQGHVHGSQTTSMQFVMDTSKFWFRPHISRVEAEGLVQRKEPGAFVVRESTSYRGCFGLTVKVDRVPANISPTNQTGESSTELVRHFLIESSAKGVRIKGPSQEAYFGSLSALIYQHTITPYALPCKLRLQSHDLGPGEETTDDTASEDKSRSACNYLYLNAVPTEMLTGACAVQRAVTATLQKDPGTITPTLVNLNVSLKGVTMTDIKRKLFFRRHYPANLLSYSGEDPERRQWLRSFKPGRMFGIVTKGTSPTMENVCHIFAESDPLQPSNHTIDVIQGAIGKP